MPEIWFRRRRPDEGQGYSIANAKGLVAAIACVIVTTAVLVTPPILGRGSVASVALGAALFVAAVVGFLLLIRKRSDWAG